MALMSKAAFGSKENIEAAKEAGKIDAYDTLHLSNGELGWLDKDGNTVINTPRTQAEYTASCVGENNVVPAESTLDEVVAVLTDTIMAQLKAEALEEAKEYADSVASGSVEIVEF